MKKDNLFNRIFHSKEVKESKKQYELSKKFVGLYPETIQYVEAARTLEELLEAHKLAWSRGYRNKNLGPCEYGMFRTKDILNMTPSEVYLGNIYGLWTYSIPHWNKKDIMAGNTFGISNNVKVYDIIMSQYRRILLSNINTIKFDALNFINKYENL